MRGKYSPLFELPGARASRSCCQLHHKRKSQRRVCDCETSRSQLHCSLRLARHTTADRMAARRKLGRRRDDLCAGELGKRVLS